MEERVGVAEVAAIQKEEHLLPVGTVDNAHRDRQDDRRDQHESPRPATASGQFKDVLVLRAAHREQAWGYLASQPQAPIEDREEYDREESTHGQAEQQGSPEDGGVAYLLVPEILRPDAGEKAPHTQDEDQDDGEDGRPSQRARLEAKDAPRLAGLCRFSRFCWGFLIR